MCQEKEPNLARDIAVVFILASSHGSSDQEKNEPWNSDLIEHLEVQDPDPRVQLDAHEEVVQRIASRTMSPAPHDGLDIDNEAVQIAGDNSHRHDGAEFINERVQREDASQVQSSSDGEGRIPAGVGRAVVWKLLSALVS